MSRQLIFIFLFFLIISCSRNDSERGLPPINIKAEIIRTFDTIVSDTSKIKTTNIKLSLTNISDKPITYWIMKCSWPQNWIENKDTYSVLSYSCDSNYPISIPLKPKESISYNAFVCRTKFRTICTNENIIKLGFIYIDADMCKTMSDFSNIVGDKSKWNIIWSNSVELK